MSSGAGAAKPVASAGAAPHTPARDPPGDVAVPTSAGGKEDVSKVAKSRAQYIELVCLDKLRGAVIWRTTQARIGHARLRDHLNRLVAVALGIGVGSGASGAATARAAGAMSAVPGAAAAAAGAAAAAAGAGPAAAANVTNEKERELELEHSALSDACVRRHIESLRADNVVLNDLYGGHGTPPFGEQPLVVLFVADVMRALCAHKVIRIDSEEYGRVELDANAMLAPTRLMPDFVLGIRGVGSAAFPNVIRNHIAFVTLIAEVKKLSVDAGLLLKDHEKLHQLAYVTSKSILHGTRATFKTSDSDPLALCTRLPVGTVATLFFHGLSLTLRVYVPLSAEPNTKVKTDADADADVEAGPRLLCVELPPLAFSTSNCDTFLKFLLDTTLLLDDLHVDAARIVLGDAALRVAAADGSAVSPAFPRTREDEDDDKRDRGNGNGNESGDEGGDGGPAAAARKDSGSGLVLGSKLSGAKPTGKTAASSSLSAGSSPRDVLAAARQKLLAAGVSRPPAVPPAARADKSQPSQPAAPNAKRQAFRDVTNLPAAAPL